MIKLRLFTVGTVPRGPYSKIHEDFLKQLKQYVQFEHIVVKDTEAFAKHLASDAFTIVLDENGKTFTSKGFAQYLKTLEDTGRHIDVFLGGPHGISEDMKHSAHLRLSLSEMTTTHDLAHLFFLEQLYRACTINKGKTYHY